MEAIYSVQKMAEVLVAGPDSEREFILFEVQQLLDHCLDDTMKILIPVLCQHVPTWNIDLQIKSAQRLYDVVCLDLDPATANMITCASFGVIQASKGKAAPEYEELYNLWGGILVDCLPNMRWVPQEIKDVVGLVDIHTKERLYTSRKVAARVLGALAQCLDKARVEKIVLPRAVSLFDDTDIEVRGTVVESLASVGAALPIRVTEAEVWPLIERLLEPPEESRLRAAAMRTMAHILEAHREKSGNSRLFRDLLPPVFTRLSAFARRYSAEDQRLVDDDTYLLLEVASEVFGQFVYSLACFSRRTFRKEAYKAYAGMATCNGPLIRRNCAFNLPGVAKALGERYALELSGLCEYLAKDTDEEVRWILAAGIHETAALLAPKGNFERLFTAVCSLLQDESPMVRMNALAHFHDLLSAFARVGSDPASVRRLAPVFTDLNMLSEGEWRIQKSLAEQLAKCADIIPPDALLDNVLPLLYRLTEQGTPLVREAAMNATASSLRNIPSLKDRNTAIDKYWKAAAKGPFWMRLALLDGGVAAMRVFSHKRFKELFAGQMLQLATDPVANVRIRIASILPSMAPMCMDTSEYKRALNSLRNDSDVDVQQTVEKHDEKVRGVMKTNKERASLDANKYRDEQEFYGFLPRTQKRARGGRMNSTRGNFMKVRGPGVDQSSSQLSVSPGVISEAMASSAAASAARHSHRPKLPETDSVVYLSSSMENVEMHQRINSAVEAVSIGNAGHDDHVKSSLAQASTLEGNTTLSQLAQTQRKDEFRRKKLFNDNVHVVQQKSQGKTARYEARSKSWNGMLAQIPRQLSMEARSRRHANATKTDDQLSSESGKQGKETSRKSLTHWRRKKKRGENRPVLATEEDAQSTGSSIGGNEFLENSRLDGRLTGVSDTNSMSREDENSLSITVESTEFASMGTLPSQSIRNDSSPRRIGKKSAQQQSISSASISGSGRGPSLSNPDVGNTVPVVFEGNTGLPSFKGNAPWTRSRGEDEDLEAISDAAHKKMMADSHSSTGDQAPALSQGRSVMSSFHNSTSKVFGTKSSQFHTSRGSHGTGDGSGADESSNVVNGGVGFFRGLFRRRR